MAAQFFHKTRIERKIVKREELRTEWFANGEEMSYVSARKSVGACSTQTLGIDHAKVFFESFIRNGECFGKMFVKK